MKTATVAHLPGCNLCSGQAKDDARITKGPHAGQWAYLCEEDWKENTDQTLGMGIGQELVVAK
jgi:hypothetical protein